MENVNAYWSLPAAEVLKRVRSTMQGLSAGEATARGRLVKRDRTTPQFVRDVRLLMGQFKSPLQLILIFAIILSAALGEFANSLIVFCIVLLSGLLGFWQERRATHALMELQQMVSVTSSILRDNRPVQIPSSEVVPGDIAMLAAGDMIPGDCLLLNASDLHVNESALTGESFPAEKEPCVLPAETSLAQRHNCVFQGTSVVSGTATALV
ncbi:MAG TPA: hypothetical protein VG737_13970, partial [Cyclobacteriaceae bacterium]|nr:hypothetical protein [Cyclobacteriaceae bacterium]